MFTETSRPVVALVFAGVLAAASGCGSSGGSASGDSAPALPTSLALTADWLNHTVSLVDFDALVARADAGAGVRVGEVDLSKYAQGPYTVKLTPDGKTAVITLSAGFFVVPGATILVGGPTLPSGPSKVVFVDVASKTILGDLDTGDGATGVAITHDGSRAYVCHVGTSDVTVIDVAKRQILQQVDLGGSYAEEVSLDDSDTVGIVTYLDPATTQKNARTFAVADMATTLSTPIPLNSDAAGVPFFPGTKKAFVVLSYNPLTSPASGYALIDATNPSAPVKLAEATWTDAMYIAYQAIPAPGRGTVLAMVASDGMLRVREYGLGATDVNLVKTYDVVPTQLFGGFGAVIDAQNRMVMTMPGDRQLAVLDLTSGAAFAVPWFKEAGPLGIALR
jgi:DNA-binding beta-propeller fold protein YncE